MGASYGAALQPISATESPVFEKPKRSYGGQGKPPPWAARGNIGPLNLMHEPNVVPHSSDWAEGVSGSGSISMRSSRQGRDGSARRAQTAKLAKPSSRGACAADGVDLYAEWSKVCRKQNVRQVDTLRSTAALQRRMRAAGHAERTAGAARMLRQAQHMLLEQGQGRTLHLRGPAAVPGREGVRPASAPALAPQRAPAASSPPAARGDVPVKASRSHTNWGVPDDAAKWERGGGAAPVSRSGARSSARSSARGSARSAYDCARSDVVTPCLSSRGGDGGSSRSSTVWSAAPSVRSSLRAFMQHPPKRLPFDGAGSAVSAEMPPEFCRPGVPFWQTALVEDSAPPSQRRRGGEGRKQLRRRLDHNNMLERGGAINPALFSRDPRKSKARRRRGPAGPAPVATV